MPTVIHEANAKFTTKELIVAKWKSCRGSKEENYTCITSFYNGYVYYSHNNAVVKIGGIKRSTNRF